MRHWSRAIDSPGLNSSTTTRIPEPADSTTLWIAPSSTLSVIFRAVTLTRPSDPTPEENVTVMFVLLPASRSYPRKLWIDDAFEGMRKAA